MSHLSILSLVVLKWDLEVVFLEDKGYYLNVVHRLGIYVFLFLKSSVSPSFTPLPTRVRVYFAISSCWPPHVLLHIALNTKTPTGKALLCQYLLLSYFPFLLCAQVFLLEVLPTFINLS